MHAKNRARYANVFVQPRTLEPARVCKAQFRCTSWRDPVSHRPNPYSSEPTMKTLALAAIVLLPSLALADALNVPLKSGPLKELTIEAPKGAKADAKGGGSFVLGGKHFEVAIVAASEKDFKAEHD